MIFVMQTYSYRSLSHIHNQAIVDDFRFLKGL